jgi:hypothetical protein
MERTASGSTPTTSGTLVLERKSDRDIKSRDLYVLIDDMPEENLQFGDALVIPLAPGEHHIRVTNRMYHDDATFTVNGGEQVRYSSINVLKKGLLNMILQSSGGVLYKPILERQ